MRAKELSIVIPARHEMFVGKTVEDVLSHIEADTEVIVVLDGEWPMEPLKDHPRLHLIHHSESVGQRAACNEGVGISRAKYVMKVDAHCSFDQGFDRKMLEAFKEVGDDVTMVPLMRNLHAFDWVCPEGHRRYQGPSGECKKCGKATTMDVVWRAKPSPQSTAYCFDPEPHFQYHREWKKKQRGDIVETMSLQGSCFMMTRERYNSLNVCDEEFGSWGSQGIEVACKTWLSGSRVLCNKRTWYAHLFRTQGGDFDHPFPLSGNQVQHAKTTAREMFFKNKWPQQKYPLSWLVRRFWPVVGWKEEDLEKLEPTKRGILYYTDNQLNMKIARACRHQLLGAGLPITSVSLKPMNFGRNIHYKGKRSVVTMAKQILAGLEAMTEDIVYFAEADVLYAKEHFDFIPPRDDVFYYNGNYWFLRASDGFAVHYDVSPLSGLVAYRKILLEHWRERVEMMEKLIIEKQFSARHMGYEPMTHGRIKWNKTWPFEVFMPSVANIDIAHGNNLSRKRWSQEKFIRKPKFWQETIQGKIEGWEESGLMALCG